MIDILIEKIKQTKNPSVAGLDTAYDYLPESMRKAKTAKDACKEIVEFNCKLVDALKDIVPAVKVQEAYYEMYGIEGMKAFSQTLSYAKSNGFIVIADVKRNDIGSTAGCYSKAFLSGAKMGEIKICDFESDFITVNGYLGSDGLLPFVKDCEAYKKGMFVLCKTSNPSSGELQDKITQNGEPVYIEMGNIIASAGKSLTGKYGYSSVGAVVGATHKAQAESIRKKFPSLFFLIPGYGAQGGTAEDLSVCFDKNGLGGIVNSSRGILCAYRKEEYKNLSFDQAARAAALDMQEDIVSALSRHGKNL